MTKTLLTQAEIDALLREPIKMKSPKISIFKTSKGSTYVVDSTGVTRRFKVEHAGHNSADVGWKETSDLTVYISTKGCDILLDILSNKRAVMVIQESRILLCYQEDGKWVYHNQGIKTVFDPAIGLHPVEFWGVQTNVNGATTSEKYHIGNNIVSIQ